MDEQTTTKPRLHNMNTARDMSVQNPSIGNLEPTNRSNEPSSLSIFSEQKPSNIALKGRLTVDNIRTSNFNSQDVLREMEALNIQENPI